MNIIFFAIVLIAFVSAGWRQIHWLPASGMLSPMEGLTKAMVESAAGSVELALGLVGVMTLFLGLMKVAEAGGMLTILARLIRPLMVRLFPRVPPEHPAMGSMILNMSANALGLGNAATPFGIRAMQELDKLNSKPGTATDSMVLFLAINTSNVTILPTGVMAIRAAAGSADPAGILPTTLFATLCSTLVAILAAKVYGRMSFFRKTRPEEEPETAEGGDREGMGDQNNGRRGHWEFVRKLFLLDKLGWGKHPRFPYSDHHILWKNYFAVDYSRSHAGLFDLRGREKSSGL